MHYFWAWLNGGNYLSKGNIFKVKTPIINALSVSPRIGMKYGYRYSPCASLAT